MGVFEKGWFLFGSEGIKRPFLGKWFAWIGKNRELEGGFLNRIIGIYRVHEMLKNILKKKENKWRKRRD